VNGSDGAQDKTAVTVLKEKAAVSSPRTRLAAVETVQCVSADSDDGDFILRGCKSTFRMALRKYASGNPKVTQDRLTTKTVVRDGGEQCTNWVP
jgi:hypothetical protein